MPRSYYSKNLKEFLNDENNSILGELTKNHSFSLEEQQRDAWRQQILILKEELSEFDSGHILFEYSIPRMGKRVDVVFIYSGLVFIIEFKVNADEYKKGDIDQCLDYALDLKNFHAESHDLQLIPILISTSAPDFENVFEKFDDDIFKPLKDNGKNLKKIINKMFQDFNATPIDPIKWESSIYKPTPTIIEAAQALYQGHDVKEISRSDAGAENLTRSTDKIKQIISDSKKNRKKSICFLTGVPGSGKTLAGLNIANETQKFEDDEHAVFLSGNGPLVKVLQEALARYEVENSVTTITKAEALRKSSTFIQNIHHYRDDALNNPSPPIEKVVIFDESQRAWDLEQTASFMSRKKNIPDFDKSEPEFLIGVLDRHEDWSTIICLVGGGQEIHIGEAGIMEWFSAIKNKFPDWNVYLSSEIQEQEYTRGNNLDELLIGIKTEFSNELHLKTSIRSFRNENVSNFVKSLLDIKTNEAASLYNNLKEKYPIVITRDLSKAKEWLRTNMRGTERIGLVVSSGAHRLKPVGIFIQDFDAPNWFLNPKDDVRSSYFLEIPATEFDIQGLELDWTCVSWDADFYFNNDKWEYRIFRGKNWAKTKNELYLKNAYRVLLTRARQGMVIFIPHGNADDYTRMPEFYDQTYNYLKNIGILEI